MSLGGGAVGHRHGRQGRGGQLPVLAAASAPTGSAVPAVFLNPDLNPLSPKLGWLPDSLYGLVR